MKEVPGIVAHNTKNDAEKVATEQRPRFMIGPISKGVKKTDGKYNTPEKYITWE